LRCPFVDGFLGHQLPIFFLTKQVQSIYFADLIWQSKVPLGKTPIFFNLSDFSAGSMVRLLSSSLSCLLETEKYVFSGIILMFPIVLA